MYNQKRIFLILVFVVLSLSVYFGSFRVQANAAVALVTPDQQEIKRVINDYFEIRYQSYKNLQLGNFDALIILNNGNQQELDKLDLTIFQHKVFQLRFQTYKYYLDYSELTFDSAGSIANVNVTEGSDVIYENSSPKPTKMRGIQHTISLQKLNGNWKIISDKYEDEFWRMLKSTNLTNVELRTKLENYAKQNALIIAKSAPIKSTSTQFLGSCTLYGINVCFNREGAVTYADDHVFNHNSDYTYINGLDCTNFVSQALFLGGGISQFIPFSWDPSSDGWYYKVNNGTHSTSWDEVDPFHAFLVPAATQRHYNYLGGPQARELDPNNPIDIQIGDIIQFDWICSTAPDCGGWDHSVIVDDIQGNSIYVDAHSDDFLHRYLYFYYPWNKIRYIHINDDLFRPFVYLPAIKGGQMIPQLAGSTAYPAPGQQASSAMSAYPPPGSNNTAKPNQAYPAP